MTIKRHKQDGRVYLSEYKSVREGKKVRSIFVRYIGPEDGGVPGRMPRKRGIDRVQCGQSVRAGDVGVLWQIAKDLDVPNIIDRYCCEESPIQGPSPGKFLTAMAINRLLDPESCTQLERWVPSTDLPRLAAVSPELFDKDAFLGSLDFLCSRDRTKAGVVDHSSTIMDTLYQKWRSLNPLPCGTSETVAYDLTSVLFFGVECPLAELGHPGRENGRKQVNLSLLVSRHDKFPLAHFVYEGSRNGNSTVDNLLAKISSISIKPGTIIWDRGCVSKDHIDRFEKLGWKVICGIPLVSKDAKAFVEENDVPISPCTYAKKSEKGHLYAVKMCARFFGRKRNLVLYKNTTRHQTMIDSENEELALIGEELDALSRESPDKPVTELRDQIPAVLDEFAYLFETKVNPEKHAPRIEWHLKSRTLEAKRRSRGKWLLLASDDSLSARDVVKAYMEKDFIEKVFRTVKTLENVSPVRHRLENRVRAYLFVCVIAYMLLAVFQTRLRQIASKDEPWEQATALLSRLSAVQRADIKLGTESRIIYLNLKKDDSEILRSIGMKNVLQG